MRTFQNDEKKKAYRIEPVLISFLEQMLDSEAFNALITNELFMYNIEEKTSEDNIDFLCRCMKRATTAAVPSKYILAFFTTVTFSNVVILS
jgi:hypothetical protein